MHPESRCTLVVLICCVGLVASGCSESDDTVSPPSTGSIEVSATTSGEDIDPDGYTVTVGTSSRNLDVNGTATFDQLGAGDHSVELTGVADNCSVSGPNPRTVAVSAGATANTTFPVSCTTTTGSIEIATSTSGSTIDPDGFTVSLDGENDQSVGANGSTTFTGVVGGDHEVELLGVASNCSVAGANPRTVTVAAGGTASTSFEVNCAFALRGQIAFESDRDGNDEIYVVGVDGSGLVNLTDDAADDRFPAVWPDGTRIAFTSDRDGNDDIYVMAADGSGVTNLTNHAAFDLHPSVSPDGTRIAFSSDRNGTFDIFVMNADGSSVTPVTSDAAVDFRPTWSPDGTKIAFESAETGAFEVFSVNVDGSELVNLTQNAAADGNPSWSPDGRIAFLTDRDGNSDIYVMDADGSNPVGVTDDPADDFAPAWSPDGAQIAFTTIRDGNREVYVIGADGSNPTNLTNNAAEDQRPHWSP